MTNNDVLRRIRYIFDMNDSKMIAVFALADFDASRAQISNWLKKDDDADFQVCHDLQLAIFLNGLINDRRGKRDGEQPKPEKSLNNNLILRKLKIALELKDVDILAALESAGVSLSKHELSAFFRKKDHQHYRVCKDQVLRNFLKGLQYKYRPESQPKPASPWNSGRS